MTAKSRIFLFFFLAYSGTWIFWWIAVAIGKPVSDPVTFWLLAIGGLFVPASALFLTYATYDPTTVRDYWSRLLDFKRLSFGGVAAAVLIMPTTAIVAIAFDGHRNDLPRSFAHLYALASQPLLLFSFLGLGFVFGPVPEEMGWRGYALKPLQQAYGVLAGVVLLSCVHAVWHLPLFYLAGSYQQELGVLTTGFWLFMASTMAFGVIAAALFNAMSESVLAVILLHWSANMTQESFNLSSAANWYWKGSIIILAVFLVIVTRGKLFLQNPASRSKSRYQAS